MGERDFHEELSQVLSQLTAAVTNMSLYSATHPQVVQTIAKAHTALVSLLEQEPEITFLVIGNDLVVGNRPVTTPGALSYIENFTRILKKKAVERLSFITGLPKSELQSLIAELASTENIPVRSSPCIKIGKVELRAPQGGLQDLAALIERKRDELKELYLNLKQNKKIDVRGVNETVREFVRAFRRGINPLTLLASLKSVHEYTFTHVANVSILTMSQAEALGFSGEYLHRIGVASLLHDVGKIFIPEEILNKPGKLSEHERKIIETHTVKGASHLMGMDGIPKLAVLTALEHHLKFDGSGYPSIKGGWRPNIVSQLISIADVFDAMRSARSYQGALPLPQIVDVLEKGRGASFNPELVRHFFRLIGHQAG